MTLSSTKIYSLWLERFSEEILHTLFAVVEPSLSGGFFDFNQTGDVSHLGCGSP